MDMVVDVFLWFFYSTLTASVVALLVMAVQKMFHRRMSARFRHLLWMIVLLRLLLPDFPDSPVSMFHGLPYASDIKRAVLALNPFADGQTSKELPQNSQENVSTPNHFTTMNEKNHGIAKPVLPEQAQQQQAPAASRHGLALQLISLVWLIGSVTIIAALFAYTQKIKRRFRTYKRITDEQTLAVMNNCRRKFRIRQPIPLYTGSDLIGPYVFGIVTPRVYLPQAMEKELDHVQLAHVLAHEVAHVKRRDTLWNTLSVWALAIHWMNPLVWLCVKQMKTDGELACDACALEVLGEAEAIPYGLTMIEFLKHASTKQSRQPLLFFFESNDKKEILRRITMIQSFKKGSYRLSAIAVMCVVCIGTAALTHAAQPGAGSIQGSHAVSSLAANKKEVLVDAPIRSYTELERAVKVADFPFKVPAALPKGYMLLGIDVGPEDVMKHGSDENKHTGKKRTMVRMYLQKMGNDGEHDYIDGGLEITAIRGGVGLDAAYTEIVKEEELGWPIRDGSIKEMKKETLNVQGVNVLKAAAHREKEVDKYSVWLDNGVQYRIHNRLDGVLGKDITDADFAKMITSMTAPDQQAYKQYTVQRKGASRDIYDTDDLQQVQKAIGFAPKFPVQPLGKYRIERAQLQPAAIYLGEKDGKASESHLLNMEYMGADINQEGIYQFWFVQFKDVNLLEQFKKTGMVLDGSTEKRTGKTSSVSIAGKEVIKTEVLQENASQQLLHVSYTWAEQNAYYAIGFNLVKSKNNPDWDKNIDQSALVEYLMKQQKMNLADPK